MMIEKKESKNDRLLKNPKVKVNSKMYATEM